MNIKSLLKDFLHLIFPNNCLVCGENLVEGEEIICLSCLYKMPRTDYHLYPESDAAKRFWGKVQIEKTGAYFYFQKESAIQKLLHELKYRNGKEVGLFLGKHIGESVSSTFSDVDIIIPVPLHKKRLRKRGYNQSALLAEGLSEALQKPIDTSSLYRAIENPTQTKKGVFERWENTQGIFCIQSTANIRGKHILLIDDVMTTGSTLEACAQTLLKTEGVKVSILTVAVA
jgi:ComF family protein